MEENNNNKVKKKEKKNKSLWLVIIVFLIGVGILLYPTLSDTLNQYRNAEIIKTYNKTIHKMNTDDKDQIWDKAVEYNKNHTQNKPIDAFGKKSITPEHSEYESLLNPMGNGVMGTITIQKIKERIAIYHGLGNKELEKGCGHMEGTSLPVGMQGENGSHAVLAAHRGLPFAKLFSDLDQMKKGDKFIITVMDHNMAYEVDQIETVLPGNVEYLELVPGQDYVTLVTCTPYAVNTHRLLVRGHRVPYEDKKVAEDVKKVDKDFKKKVLLLGALIAFIIVSIIALNSRNSNKKKTKK